MPALRPWGYLAALAAASGGLLLLVLRRPQAPLSASAIAERVERLFPQSRGRARDVVAGHGPGALALARAEDARAWIAGRSTGRLDSALAAADRPAVVRARRAVAAALGLLLLLAALDPGAARRVAGALAAPERLWSGPAWEVEPGDAVIAHGAAVEGRVRLLGLPTGEPLVLEWKGGGERGADTLGSGTAGAWRWPAVTAPRTYRFRAGAAASRVYRIEVGAPLALEGIVARAAGGSWEPLAGAVVAAGERIEVRGRANAALAGALVERADGGAAALTVAGDSLHGFVTPSAGAWRVTLRAADGRTAAGATFHAVAAGAAFVIVLEPRDDPARLEALSAWVEARAGAPRGIGAVRWETADGRGGPLGDGGGARDTVVTGLAPLAEGRSAGDTVRYRLVARLAGGGAVAGEWRTAVLADASFFQARADEARTDAARAAERAATEARGAAERSAADATEADARLRQAADSLVDALEQSLADPSLPEAEREMLEAYRDLLRGTAGAELARPQAAGGGAPDPASAARARAELVERIASAVQRAEDGAARAAAADTLARLADAERALAEETRQAGRIDAGAAERQEALDRSAREAARELGEEASRAVEEALDRAQEEIAAGDPAGASAAQQEAAGAMEAASAKARRQSEEEAARLAARRAAVDRAAGETLFLAERQEAVATGEAGRAERIARQRVVAQGLDNVLATLVEGLGGRPAAAETGRLMAEAVYATRRAESALAAGGERAARAAANEAAQALALLARALLVPPGSLQMAGAQGSAGEAGAVAAQLDYLADAQRALAQSAGSTDDPSGGDPEAAAEQRELGNQLGGLQQALAEQGVDPRTVEALAQAVEEAARRLERGLPGARAETELQSLARRFADLGRIVERSEGERRAEAARPFVPARPSALPARATARLLDPYAALAPWAQSLPRAALDPSRAYLERLAEEGVRAP